MLLETGRLGIRYINRDDWKSLQEIWKDFTSSEYAQYDVWHNTDTADVRKRAARWEEGNRGTDHGLFSGNGRNKAYGWNGPEKSAVRETASENGVPADRNGEGILL